MSDLPRSLPRLLAFGILAALWGALAYQAWDSGVTVDEPSHLLSAYLYWRGQDKLQPRDLPPLIKIVGGWVPALTGLPVPYDHPLWADQHEWTISLVMMERLKAEQIRRLFFLARLPLLIFPLLTAFLLWRWAAELFGPWTAVLLTLAFALEPTALAHGSLFKNDLAAAFGYLFFWRAAWRFWRRPGAGPAVRLAFGLLTAVLAKLSMLVLGPPAVAVVLLRRVPQRRIALLCLGLILLIPYLGSLAACRFEARPLSSEELAALDGDPAIPIPVRAAARLFGLLPAPLPMWQGALSLIHSNAANNRIYLWGRIYTGGHPLYFLAALAVKTPVPLQILAVCGAVILLARAARRRFAPTDLFWLLPPVLYVVLASLSSLQLGVRLILPALPFGLLLCGVAMRWMLERRRLILLSALLVWLGVQSARIYPQGIAFFNLPAGGPNHGLRYLADSNLDWGQSLRQLARYVRQAGIPRLRLSYFGMDNPWAYFNDSVLELLPPPWHPDLVEKGRLVYQPEPGYYAISASLLPGHLFEPEYQEYYKHFRERKPIAKVGYSIYVYRVDPLPAATGLHGAEHALASR